MKTILNKKTAKHFTDYFKEYFKDNFEDNLKTEDDV